MKRLLCVVLVLTFGSSLFIAGASAPPRLQASVRSRAGNAAQSVAARIESAVARVLPGMIPNDAASGLIPYEALVLDAAKDPARKFGIQLALLVDLAEANTERARLPRAVVDPQVFAVGSDGEAEAYVLALGPFDEFDTARRQLGALELNLPSGWAPTLIAWPNSSAKALASAQRSAVGGVP